MIALPIFQRLDVNGYALFPGSKSTNPGLHLRFHPGLTLIVGANGLGKTTLITLLYRMITGPYDIPALTSRLTLGNADLQPRSLSTTARDQFRTRVADNALNATATLQLRVGETRLTITRRLRNLTLEAIGIDGQDIVSDDLEAAYQADLIQRIGVGAFGDVILLLRHVIFLFEDRRTLVWDPGAQKQLLRLLFLPPDVSTEWTVRERAILELDSEARNLRAVAFAREAKLTEEEAAEANAIDIRAELKTLEEYQDKDADARNALLDSLDRVDENRRQARLRQSKAEAARDSQFRELEHASLAAISARYPSKSNSALYLLTQLVADGTCRFCGHQAQTVVEDLCARRDQNRCIICDNHLNGAPAEKPEANVADALLQTARAALIPLDSELLQADALLRDTEHEYTQVKHQLAQLDEVISERERRINALVARLPPGEQGVHNRRTELYALRSAARDRFLKLDTLRSDFALFVERASLVINQRASAVAKSFDRYARDFMVETCRLYWSPQHIPLGQTGEPLSFPAFQVELSGADFPIPARRMGPEQVSESQREFIDLAFRMALIEVATDKKGGSLVIDAPESSLDTIFTDRAATVLGSFARAQRSNRLIITSNLVEGSLIPRLVSQLGQRYRDDRLVNLMREAAPTGAVATHKAEYAQAFMRLTRLVRRREDPTTKIKKRTRAK